MHASPDDAESSPGDSPEDFALAPPDLRPTGGGSDHLQRALADERERRARQQELVTRVPDLLYPFGLVGLGGWIPMAIWSALAGGMWGMTLVWGQEIGLIALRALLPSSVILSVVAVLFSAACCVACVESTGNGTEVEEWPALGEWKEWGWSGLLVLFVFAQMLLLASAFTWWLMMWTVWAPAPLALMLLPLGLLSAAEDDRWLAYSPRVLRSLGSDGPRWLRFHLQWAGLLALTALISYAGVMAMNWWFLVLAAPLLATVLLIGARLLGRVACNLSTIH